MEKKNLIVEPSKEARKEAMIQQAGELASYYKAIGFHCPEATIRACADALGITLSEDIKRCASGFMGGGGGCGERCGVLEAGCMLVSLIYGRVTPVSAMWANNSLIRRLHARFHEEMKCLNCRDIQELEINAGHAPELPSFCEHTFVEGSRLIVRLILESDELLASVTDEEKAEEPD